MAFTTITLTNGIELKQAPIGFSWTTLLFGCFPALFRQDWIMAAVIAILGMCTWGVSSVVFAFIYNKMYAKSLIMKGYKVMADPNDSRVSMVQENLGLVSLPCVTPKE